nr:hypothetical protein GCM10020241_56210 [Streptoalloteichus tenebrarius]
MRVNGVDPHGLLHDPGQLARIRSTAKVVEGAAGHEVHHQHLVMDFVPGMGVHQDTVTVAVQPWMANPGGLRRGGQHD